MDENIANEIAKFLYNKELDYIFNITDIRKISLVKLYHLCKNKNAIYIIKENIKRLDKKCWISLCENNSYEAIEIIKENINDNLDWDKLCHNYYAYDLLLKNIEKCNINYLCNNTHPKIIEYLEKEINNFTSSCWVNICSNENAINIIKKYIFPTARDKSFIIYSEYLAKNKNEEVIMFLENQTKISDNILKCSFYNSICMNENKNIHKIIIKNFDKITKYFLTKIYSNHSIFDYIIENKLIEKEMLNNKNILNYLSYNSNINALIMINNHLNLYNDDFIFCINGLISNNNPYSMDIIKKFINRTDIYSLIISKEKILNLLLENPKCFNTINNDIIFSSVYKNILSKINI